MISGRRRLLRCLLEIQCLLMDTESRYILNDLYVTDYCVWIQTVRYRAFIVIFRLKLWRRNKNSKL